MLRRANEADAPQLGALHVASWHETYAGMLPDEMLAGLSVDMRSTMWARILRKPEDFGCVAVFVVEDGGCVVGFGSCARQRDTTLARAGFDGEISAIHILRSHHGRGIGRGILAAMARALSTAGLAAASLWVLRENHPARAFYERLGGEIVSEKTDDRPNGTLIEVAYGWRDLPSLFSI